jgi:uncharacterized protein YecE (DUF72 family)
MSVPANLRLGTVSWSKPDWVGSFYPADLKPPQFLEFYARRFNAVEIDSTFYRIPTPSMVTAWKERTPAGFIFAAKVPRRITHTKVLSDCQSEMTAFLKSMEILDERLGPLLLQFPYFNKNVFASREPFEKLLYGFLKTLPKDFQIAVEIRNKNWIGREFLDLLREHSVSFVVTAQAWMPGIETLAGNPVTGACCYVRFMGDRKAIESKTQKWNTLIEDRTEEMAVWANELKKIVAQGIKTYAFFSNYYAGFGPGSAELFAKLWDKRDGK